jgi:mevalonate kinase
MTRASAPGKIILFGEHAVVYGRPALAVPVRQVWVDVEILDVPHAGIWIHAPGIDLHAKLDSLPRPHPLASVMDGVFNALSLRPPAGLTVTIESSIPVASGLGSGAAVSVALIRALSAHFGHPLPDEQVNALAYASEKLHHGTPSGVDNTVITYARPVFFVREINRDTLLGHLAAKNEKQKQDLKENSSTKKTSRPLRLSGEEIFPQITPLLVKKPFSLVIGNTGIPAPTKESVGDVRGLWMQDPARWEAVFDKVGEIVIEARRAIEGGNPHQLGALMDANHALLQEMTVSCPALDGLVAAARSAGALGAKLSGGGRGGNMIALVEKENAPQVCEALQNAGAKSVLVTVV